MLGHRRRKKRPNYGIRTVEVDRGANGFGFTISGQQPCILSCIVANSPAEQAGLKAGDFLISVNGLSVSKVTHDAVVKLIGNSVGPIKMSIAEYYYSDSSDEEFPDNFVPRSKPRYPHRSRAHKSHKTDVSSSKFIDKFTKSPSVSNKPLITDHRSSILLNRTKLLPPCPGYKALIGYLGTIEMPSQLQPSTRMQTVCSCIRRFRQEKRSPSTVVMMVLPSCVTLTNVHDHTLAIYPANRVVYISCSSEKDSCYFGLITVAEQIYSSMETSPRSKEDTEVDISNSCHVFVIDAKIADHSVHANKATTFNIQCTRDVITGACLEFPRTSEYIVNLVQKMYGLPRTTAVVNRLPDIKDHQLIANSPQPSASSNSDSGIGFRDECGLVSDRILVVDFPPQPPLPPPTANTNRPAAIDGSSISIDTLVSQQNHHLSKSILERSKSSDNIADTVFKTPTVSSCEFLKNLKNTAPKSLIKTAAFISHEDLNSIQSEPFLNTPSNCDDNINGVCNKMTTNFGSLQELAITSSVSSGCSFQTKNLQMSAISEPDVRIKAYLDDETHNFITPNEQHIMLEDVDKNESQNVVTNWAAGFDKLLEDYRGRQAFTEFLKKEFSAENIHFWISCENYQNLESSSDRIREAQIIYNTHLCKGAPEPVNVDSQARNITQEALQQADPELFAQAQKQIFNLMKFDSYPRFLKSDLYKQCLSTEDVRDTTRNETEVNVSTKGSASKLKKSLSNAEDRRRKSLLPWHRKNRSKSKDRGEMEYSNNGSINNPGTMYNNTSSCVGDSDMTNISNSKRTGGVDITGGSCYSDQSNEKELYNSRSSLTSWDITDDSKSIGDTSSINASGCIINRSSFCRVILSDGATTVVQIRPCETIKEMINRLLDKRGLQYTNYEAYLVNKSKPIDLNKNSSELAGCEVIIEHRIVFKLDLPNRKIISVKSKPTKILVDVLRPILHKYGYKLELVNVLESAKSEHCMNVNVPVTVVDGYRLLIQMKTENSFEKNPQQSTQSLDEITNKVFEELLQDKSNNVNIIPPSDQGSMKSDDWGSEHSSGIFGRLLRRDSTTNEKRMKKLLAAAAASGSGNRSNKSYSQNGSIEDVRSTDSTSNIKKPLIAKWKPGIKLHVAHKPSVSDELYEGLKRAQRSRLEDQRGTEINFELPDFLKDKENSDYEKKNRKPGISDNFSNTTALQLPVSSVPLNSTVLPNELYEFNENKNTNALHNHDRNIVQYYLKSPNSKISSDSDSKMNDEHKSPSKFSNCSSSNFGSPIKYDLENTVLDNIKHCNTNISPKEKNLSISNSIIQQQNMDLTSICEMEPPPLPPKPKILPIKPSNWRKLTSPPPITSINNSSPTISKDNQNHSDSFSSNNSNSTFYLDQPSSSFV